MISNGNIINTVYGGKCSLLERKDELKCQHQKYCSIPKLEELKEHWKCNPALTFAQCEYVLT